MSEVVEAEGLAKLNFDQQINLLRDSLTTALLHYALANDPSLGQLEDVTTPVLAHFQKHVPEAREFDLVKALQNAHGAAFTWMVWEAIARNVIVPSVYNPNLLPELPDPPRESFGRMNPKEMVKYVSDSFVHVSHKLVEPAMDALLQGPHTPAFSAFLTSRGEASKKWYDFHVELWKDAFGDLPWDEPLPSGFSNADRKRARDFRAVIGGNREDAIRLRSTSRTYANDGQARAQLRLAVHTLETGRNEITKSRALEGKPSRVRDVLSPDSAGLLIDAASLTRRTWENWSGRTDRGIYRFTEGETLELRGGRGRNGVCTAVVRQPWDSQLLDAFDRITGRPESGDYITAADFEVYSLNYVVRAQLPTIALGRLVTWSDQGAARALND
jgi:hypothetical protein